MSVPAAEDAVVGSTPPDDDGGRLAFLAEVSRLLADSLDLETTLATAAGLALPHFGTWCMVDLVEAEGGPKASLREEGVYSVNRRNELVWAVPLKAGEEPGDSVGLAIRQLSSGPAAVVAAPAGPASGVLPTTGGGAGAVALLGGLLLVGALAWRRARSA